MSALALAAMLGPAVAHAHMPRDCMGQMRKMNTWMAPKKADAARMGATGRELTALVPARVRVALAEGKNVPPDWTLDLDKTAMILDAFGAASSTYLYADAKFTEELGKLLVCIAKGR